MVTKLTAICPLDGRYTRKTDGLAEALGRKFLSSVDEEQWEIVKDLSQNASEHSLIKNRVTLEAAYLQELGREGLIELSREECQSIEALCDVKEADAQAIKNIEVRGVEGINNGLPTNHDVKSVELHMRKELEKQGFSPEKLAMIHLALTSEDIDSNAYTIMFRDGITTSLTFRLESLENMLKKSAATRDYAEDIAYERLYLEKKTWTGKFGGAIGNRSAHRIAYLHVDWEEFGKRFVGRFNLELNPMTTQIEPCDTINEVCKSLMTINSYVRHAGNVLNTLQSRYIGDLLLISNSLLEEFSRKQPISRRQRDLSGSTIRRNYNTATAFTAAAIEYCFAQKEGEWHSSPEKVAEKINIASGKATKRLDELLGIMTDMADKYKDAPMLGETHGQPAIPTTLGKEIANFAYRIYRQRKKLDAHIQEKRGREVLDTFDTINTVLIDFSQDVWQYISSEYILQKPKPGQVGSSTMSQKVNPIDFENAEGNLMLSNALLKKFARIRGPTRAIEDNIGMPFGYAIIAYNSLINGMGKITGNPEKMSAKLDEHWEVMAEPIQTILRTTGDAQAYEKLKEATQGKKMWASDISDFVVNSKLDPETSKKIFSLTPHNYLGDAVSLTEKYMAEVRNYLKPVTQDTHA